MGTLPLVYLYLSFVNLLWVPYLLSDLTCIKVSFVNLPMGTLPLVRPYLY